MSSPPSPIVEAIGATTPPDHPPKDKRRQRLLRGIQRISSSPSLAQFSGRSRSSSAPYGARPSLSCVSLAGTPSFGLHNTGSFTPDYFGQGQSSVPVTPNSEFPPFDGALPTRKVAHTSAACSTVALPADVVRSRSSTVSKKAMSNLWVNMPYEIRVHIFSYLAPKELVRISCVSKEFYKFCFDGQLWTRFDATEFYQDIPAESLAKIIVAAGPFVKDLNLRGCVQMEHHKRAEVVVTACQNLINATLEGCRNFHRATLHNLIRNNEKLTNLNLTSLTAVTNSTCKIIAQHCPQIETLNLSWCPQMDARGVKQILLGCHRLKDLRVGEVKGFDNLDVAQIIFKTNRLERLVLAGCTELTDRALSTMMHGVDPEIDILTDRPVVPARKLRHLDLSRCVNLTSSGVQALGHLLPELEGLQLNGCSLLNDTALEPILASTPRLTHLELEDLSNLTNEFLSEHLAKSPCAPKLEHLTVSYCENFGDVGMLPVIKKCTSLKSVDMDNTKIGDLVLTEAAAMVRLRSARTQERSSRPTVELRVVAYDCQNVTWTGVREVLSWNAEIRQPSGTVATYPTEIIGLKCYYGWQQTVEQHTQRVLRGDYAAASRLERKWADYMQAYEEAGATGAGIRRRRRRVREAQMLHDEEEGGIGFVGRRRARTVAGSCSVM